MTASPKNSSSPVVNRQMFDDVMVPNYAPGQVVPVRGQGVRIWDQQDKEYLDFACGIAVTGLGHCHPALVEALTNQANRLWHLSNVMTNEPALQLAKRLTEISFAEKVFFANSGTEANEAAFKLARKHASRTHGPEKREIVSCLNAFHGRSLFAVSVGGQAKYTEGFEPLPGGIRHVPFNDVDALKAAVGQNTCAVVVEPVQGEGGVTPATEEFLKACRSLCDQHQALLVMDEVQTGNGRCGPYFAHEAYGVTPDILATAKGLGGGFPVAAMLTTTEIAESLAFGTHGSTYGGNPLACSVALAAVNEISKPELRQNVDARSRQLLEGLDSLSKKHGVFGSPRGMGLLIGAPLAKDFSGCAKQLVGNAMNHGLWTLVAGPDVLRLAPPLIISEAEVEFGLQRLDKACESFLAEQKATA